MKNALVGYTGFVGSNLNNQFKFDYLYNSKNIEEIKRKNFDLLVFAGVPAVKWLANKEPENDLKIVMKLEEILKTVDAKKFILISTIDVYSQTQNLDEDFDCSSISNQAYGTNRLRFEQFCDDHFKNCTIVRLPGLFGKGIKKNVIFDLLNNNCLDMINKDSYIQYYDLKNLWADIQKANEFGLNLINLFTEPVSSKEIIDNFFPEKNSLIGANKSTEVHYNLFTKHAMLWKNSNKYIYTKEQVLNDLKKFIETYGK